MNEYWDWSGGLGEGQLLWAHEKFQISSNVELFFFFFNFYKPLLELDCQNPALTATRLWLDRREFG